MKKENNNKKSIYIILLGILAAYIVLLLLLYRAEIKNPYSNIRSFGDAVWYSIVTLTTVGYGDMTPSTPVGHLVGSIFLILSMGLLVTLMSTAYTFITGEAMPLLLLQLKSHKNWYYFCDFGLESNLMARDIVAHDENAVIIFGEQKNKEMEVPEYPCYFLNDVPARLVKLKRGKGAPCKVFFMRENDIYQNIRAIDIDKLPVEIYAHTTSGQEKISEKMHFFHSYDCCARQYWMDNLLTPTERSIVIIGFGNYGRALLERAIMMNVYTPEQNIAYHIFGDATEFIQEHPKLREVFSIDYPSDNRDMIFFHNETWRTQFSLIREADRIIICNETEVNAWKVLWQLRRYYVTKGRIFIRSSQQVPEVQCFGSAETIYTCDNILRTVQNRVAVVLNDRFRLTSPENFIEWDDLDDLLKQSKMAVADHLIMKCRILLPDVEITQLDRYTCHRAYECYSRRKQLPNSLDRFRAIEHLRWLRYYCFYNWTYGTKRDDSTRTHPMMIPYEGLSEAQKESRDYAWELLRSMGEEL